MVREAQETAASVHPVLGRIEVTSRAASQPRSMFSAWMIGMEDEPERSGEICIVEIFGKTLGHDADERPTAQLGCGIHAFRDPALIEDFAAPVVPLDITQDHAYAVDWTERSVTFSVDGQVVRSCEQSPTYPMQLILGVFDFPAGHRRRARRRRHSTHAGAHRQSRPSRPRARFIHEFVGVAIEHS